MNIDGSTGPDTRAHATARKTPVVIAAGFGVAILAGLGTWQVERLKWKEGILAQISARREAPMTSVPPPAEWASLKPNDYDYRHVAAIGTFETAQSALVYRGGAQNAPGEGPGYLVMTPLRLPDGVTIIVNRGFVPLAAADTARENVPQGAVSVTGLMRPPEARNAFTPADEPSRGIWYTRDPASIGAKMASGSVAPFTIDADADPRAKGWPRAGTTQIDIPNNHLSYALTWYGLAAALIGVTFVFLRTGRRPSP